MNNFSPSVSIIVPARNEAGTIKKIVRELPDLGRGTEIVFIENRSQDNTWEEIKRVASAYIGPKLIKFISLDYQNKAEAVRKGFEMAAGDMCIIYDADMTVLPEEIGAFYEALLSGRGQLINGTRFIYPMEKQAMRQINSFGNQIYSWIMSRLSGQKITDTLCGTKAVWREDYKQIKNYGKGLILDDPFGDFELLLGAIRNNFKIVEVPVNYKARIYGKTNIKRWKQGWLLFKILFLAAFAPLIRQIYNSKR